MEDPEDITRKIFHQSFGIKSKLLTSRFILASSYRMGFSFVVSWTKEKLLGVTWEIQSVWNDITMRRLPNYNINDTEALNWTCREANKLLSTLLS
ncbi:hypothetical protein Goklo_011339 [Gossypium klotzschianum]|uniref:Uncharacterized protein n=1 Tax=Gossypium klotzschianum TaxID=34286 RepID=A0A7J8V902_9ROSI|nr:hypothetical protein [Gossypium klotzschianum]